MELPLVISKVGKDPLRVFKPTEAQVLVEGEHLIATQEDLEKVDATLLVELYNLAVPGVVVNAFKPGTIIRYCYPALLKLAKEQEPVATNQETTKETEMTKPKSEAKVEAQKAEKKAAVKADKAVSLSGVIKKMLLAGKPLLDVMEAATKHPKYANTPDKAKSYVKAYRNYMIKNEQLTSDGSPKKA